MSRRPKLIIAAIFLLLLAIPTVYVVLTWSPRNPLRVRALPGVRDAFLVGWTSHQVEVENVSGATLKVYDLHGNEPSMPRSPNIYQMLPRMKRMNIWLEGSTRIPSLGTERMELQFEQTTPESQPPEEVLCVYASSTKDLAIRFLNWCYLYSPVAVKGFIPEVQPEFYYGPLKPAS